MPEPFRRKDFSPKELTEDVYLNKIWTFGVTSAGYWWGRAGGSSMRLGHYFVGYEEALWPLQYSDNGDLVARTDFLERGILLLLLALVVVRNRLAWKKLKGGAEVGSVTCWTCAGSRWA